ncbi:hypothetical protein Ddye_012246 [Dipteronia dyeriana]|uniref:Protein BIG GRAIN 1-like A n=1 Tax=Dipteronia dyeriana TaxID=168575 RepID=A0AAE0CID8_9ROSI|nr:hypothetical protein Ddye_012246 [Dipteronia dyeriana]
MDVWEKSLSREDHHNTKRRENPSFSSTLLDAIYRSIDEPNGSKGADHHHHRRRHRDQEEELIFYKEKTMRKKKHSGNINEEEVEEEMRRACMIERWIEKKTSCEKVVVRRKSMADFDRMKTLPPRDELLMKNSSSSSSDSSCGGGFSSESDSFYAATAKKNSCYSMPRPKPIRTSISTGQPDRYEKAVFHQTRSENSFQVLQKPIKKNHENGFMKTKSKAMKIYSDLKKVKQPISPGGRLASFLNSLFTAGNAKKAKISSSNNAVHDQSISSSTTTCSSASSFSRSCLSNTPSSRGKLSSNNNGMKRSVRFYPVSVIVDEDCRPCGHKNLSYENNNDHDHVMSENRRVAEAARELLKSYQKKKEDFDDHDHQMIKDICDVNGRLDVEDDDDAASCASSDLFELDTIGIERYREELPVYETTHLGTNRAIASGLIL